MKEDICNENGALVLAEEVPRAIDCYAGNPWVEVISKRKEQALSVWSKERSQRAKTKEQAKEFRLT
jgi:hypothetical protein